MTDNTFRKLFILPVLLLAVTTMAQEAVWWGAAVGLGHEQPYTTQPLMDLNKQDAGNQIAPLFVSSDGEYVWQDKPFNFTAKNGIVRTSVPFIPVKAGSMLREAYKAAQARYFAASGQMPDSLFFTRPIYSTRAHMATPTQADILRYAHAIVDQGLPAGILVIDDGWQRHYGSLSFRAEAFADARAMIDELHGLGFKVMTWVSPFVSADSPASRDLEARGWLLRDREGNTALIHWQQGHSACYDLTNPAAVEHLTRLLRKAQTEYGIDGYLFEGGDNSYYADHNLIPHDRKALNVDQTAAWAKIGLLFPLNSYRACWKMGGQPLVQRLSDRSLSWAALQQLIPQAAVAGLLGHAFVCPGGVDISVNDATLVPADQILFVRMAQVQALMPMMQVSAAPWQLLSEENNAIIRETAALHTRFAPYILQCAQQAAESGEPIIRLMEYQFPGQGFTLIKDQFMLGERYLVAPVLDEREERDVKLPAGTWRDDQGKKYKGGKIYHIQVHLNRLPYFEKLK